MSVISAALLTRLRQQAGNRCGYCRTSSRVTGHPLTVEHIIPLARRGTSEEVNLWISCRRCNEFKGIQIEGSDPETGTRVSLFHPRQQHWETHFAWSGDGTRLIGAPLVGGQLFWLYG
jgi:5-methylcytosine-specific restriction endonuclease McrA